MKITSLAAIVVGVFFAAQLVPFGREHANPPVVSEPSWSSEETRKLFYRACSDCHTNETEWPWYSFVAPISWLVQHDVDDGRSHLNVSEWDRQKQHGDEAAEKVRSGEMPLWFYDAVHRDTRLSEDELKRLVAGLEATFGTKTSKHDHEGHAH